jgi:hypothetical protein
LAFENSRGERVGRILSKQNSFLLRWLDAGVIEASPEVFAMTDPVARALGKVNYELVKPEF